MNRVWIELSDEAIAWLNCEVEGDYVPDLLVRHRLYHHPVREVLVATQEAAMRHRRDWLAGDGFVVVKR